MLYPGIELRTRETHKILCLSLMSIKISNNFEGHILE
jgi:hypothetical protein